VEHRLGELVVAPPSASRRDIPARPVMNIGMKMPFMQTNDGQKCSARGVSLIERPVAFGYQ
jgi:hypothetical protein